MAAQKFAPPPIHWAAGCQPAAGRPPATSAAMQRKPAIAPPAVHWPATHKPVAAPPAAVQAMKAFSATQRPGMNRRHSAGDELVSGSGAFQLRSHDKQVMSRPSGVYNFVRVQGMTRNQAATYMGAKSPHAALAAGRPVLYAGTAAFDGGDLKWWSNYSGTYQPQAAFSRQAALPEDKFVPWQKLQLGGVGLQRGMLADKRTVTAPDSKKFLAKPAETKAEAKPVAAPADAKPHAPAHSAVPSAKKQTKA